MTPEEARIVLGSMRPDRSDAEDPLFREALDLVESDEELREWFEGHQAVDRMVAEKLRALELPADLRTGIHASLSATRRGNRWKRAGILFAVAALMAAVAVPLILMKKRSADSGVSLAKSDSESFRGDMLHEIETLTGFDFVSADVGQIREWMDAQERFPGFPLPGGIVGWPSLGCKVVDWRGRRATLICFKENESAPGPSAHLVIVEGTLFPDLKGTRFTIRDDWSTVVWNSGGRTYFLATPRTEAELRRMLGDVSGVAAVILPARHGRTLPS